MSSEVKWSDLVYVQRDVADKEQFAKNWELIFGKKDEKERKNANNESKDEKRKDRL